MNNINNHILYAAARKSFWLFCLVWDYDFFNNRRPFLYEIAEQYQNIADGKINRLSVSLAPRAGKSYITSLFCVWMIGNNPSGSVMRNSVTVRLYNKFSRAARGFIKSPKYALVFPTVKLADDNQGVESWSVKQAIQVSYFGNGVGGTIVGEGSSLVAITDDLFKGHGEALSEKINDSTHLWYDSEHVARMEGDCRQIDIGTRWSKSDVIGKNIEAGYYDKIIIVPALINWKSFCEDVKSTEKYLEIKDRIDSFLWDSEYMQQPIELEGTIFPTDKLQKYDELPGEGIDVFFADTADTGDDSYSAPFGRIVGNLIFIYDVVFNKYNLTENEPIMLAKFLDNNITKGYIETNNFGAYHLRTLRMQSDVNLYGVKNTGNKMLRILAESGYIIKNFRFPRKSPSVDYDKFYKQLTNLLKTGSKHDDAADSLSGLSAMARRDFIR